MVVRGAPVSWCTREACYCRIGIQLNGGLLGAWYLASEEMLSWYEEDDVAKEDETPEREEIRCSGLDPVSQARQNLVLSLLGCMRRSYQLGKEQGLIIRTRKRPLDLVILICLSPIKLPIVS